MTGMTKDDLGLLATIRDDLAWLGITAMTSDEWDDWDDKDHYKWQGWLRMKNIDLYSHP